MEKKKGGCAMNRYKEARIRAGLSQKAAAISLGVRPPSMSDWENGKSQPTHSHLVAMAALYSTTTDYLTGAADTKEKQSASEDGQRIIEKKKEPAISDDELRKATMDRIRSLPEPILEKVLDLIDAIQQDRAAGSASPAAHGPSDPAAP